MFLLPPSAPRAQLPVARLLASQDRIGSHLWIASLQRWFAERWRWVGPRVIPLMAAALGLVGVMSVRRYLLTLARGETPEPPALTQGGPGNAELQTAHPDPHE